MKLPTIETVELLDAGFDYIVVDMEHAPLTLESVYRAIFAAKQWGWGAGRTGLITAICNACSTPARRHPGTSGHPRSDLPGSVDAMRFSPTGARGLGTTSCA